MHIIIVQAFIITILEYLESSGMQQWREKNLFYYWESYLRLNDKDSKYLTRQVLGFLWKGVCAFQISVCVFLKYEYLHFSKLSVK